MAVSAEHSRPRPDEGGFTIVEVLMAMVILTIGLVALVGSSAMVTRMVGRGKTSTIAAQVAQARLDTLRFIASKTPTPCASAQFTSSAAVQTTQGVRESWTVHPASGGSRRVDAIVAYNTARGSHADTLTTFISCTAY
jgi:prepilin-type N-terminal cleavage/methylation domain-containing protein